MKKSRILAFVLATLMVCTVMVGCGNSAPKVKVDATFTVIINGDTVVNAHKAELEGTATSAPTVLEGVCTILELYGYTPEYDENALVGVLDMSQAEYATGGGNAWYYTINGKDGSKAATTVLNEGDEVVYIYGPVA